MDLEQLGDAELADLAARVAAAAAGREQARLSGTQGTVAAPQPARSAGPVEGGSGNDGGPGGGAAPAGKTAGTLALPRGEGAAAAARDGARTPPARSRSPGGRAALKAGRVAGKAKGGAEA